MLLDCQFCRHWEMDFLCWLGEKYSLPFLCVHIVNHGLELWRVTGTLHLGTCPPYLVICTTKLLVIIINLRLGSVPDKWSANFSGHLLKLNTNYLKDKDLQIVILRIDAQV